MKTRVFKLLALLILLPTIATASPFIVTEPIPYEPGIQRADRYRVCFNSTCKSAQVWNNNGSTALAYDLEWANLPNGTYRVTITPCMGYDCGVPQDLGRITIPYILQPSGSFQWSAPWE